MPIPVPPGGSIGTQQNEQFYQGLIAKYYGSAAASKYASLYSTYQAQVPPTSSQSTAYQIFNPFFAALGSGAGVSAAAQAVISAIAGVSKITASSLPQVPSPLAGLFQANIWLRVAEVALGLVLIAVGVARLTSKEIPVLSTIAKTAGAR